MPDAERWLATQEELVARWQLIADGWHPRQVERWVARTRPRVVHPGVYAVQRGPLHDAQRRRAAALTTPTSALTHHSTAAALAIYDHRSGWEAVTRPGTHGPRVQAGLRIFTAPILPGELVVVDGLRRTSAERTVIDLWPMLPDARRRELLRETVRLRRLTCASLLAALERHPNRRGTASLRLTARRYVRLQLERCRSDAEAFAMDVLELAHRPLPLVDVRVAGEEADLSWATHRLIIELDGPQLHRDLLADAHKTATWVRAGWTVRRLPTDPLFADPAGTLLALAPARTQSSIRLTTHRGGTTDARPAGGAAAAAPPLQRR